MKRLTLVAAGLSLWLSTAALAQQPALDPEVEKILRERLAVLEEAARLFQQAYSAGQTSLAGTLSANKELFEAQLELARTPAERVQVREQILKNAEALEQAVEKIVQAGEGPRMDLLRARAARLRAQADLVQERKLLSP
jgi:outer membrane protein TolC